MDVKKFCSLNDLEVRFIHQMDLESGCFTVVEGGKGGDCLACNRLRLTANGMIKPCLFNDLQFSIRDLGIREAIENAINFKPEKGSQNLLDKFHNIGG
jgi:cyclic pyranopterin phosphate synthase